MTRAVGRLTRFVARRIGSRFAGIKRHRVPFAVIVAATIGITAPTAAAAQARSDLASGVTFSMNAAGSPMESAQVTNLVDRVAASPPPAIVRSARPEIAHGAGFSDTHGGQLVAGSPWWTPLASAALPGAGQAVLKQDRFVAYMAVESYFWLRFFADRREGLRQRGAYRKLANDVARSSFSNEKPVGEFEYYERMENFIESGVFDAVPGGSIQPETDTTTFNGSIWLLARRTYWTDPDTPPPPESQAYLRAEALYRDRAVLPAFRWSWRDAQLEQDLYRRTISQSNEAFRRAVQDLGVVLANHVLSTVDAYVTIRLQRTTTPDRDYSVSVTIPWGPGGQPDR